MIPDVLMPQIAHCFFLQIALDVLYQLPPKAPSESPQYALISAAIAARTLPFELDSDELRPPLALPFVPFSSHAVAHPVDIGACCKEHLDDEHVLDPNVTAAAAMILTR